MSSGGGGGSGAVREVTLVVRVQGPQGVGGPSGIGGGRPALAAGGGARGIGGGIPGGGTPASTGIPSSAGPMPAYGSAPGDQARGYGIPGGDRGGAYFMPYGNPFGSKRAPEAPARRRPDPEPAFTSISSIPGGGGGGGFRARPGFQGALSAANQLAQTMGKIKKTTDDWANSLGRAVLEFIRLTTWSRPLTMGTWMMAEAQQKYGIPLVKGTGLAGVGVAGGLAATYLFDKFNQGGGPSSLRSLGDPAGRRGALDYTLGRFSSAFTGQPYGGVGRFERSYYAEQNQQVVQQLQQNRQTNRNLFGQGQQQVGLDLASRFAGARYNSQAMFSLGLIPWEQHWATFKTEWQGISNTRRELQSRESKLESQLGGGGRSEGYYAPPDPGPLGVGNLPSIAGFVPPAARNVYRRRAFESLAVAQERSRRHTESRLNVVRGQIAGTFGAQAEAGQIGVQQFASYIQQRQADMRQGINSREQAVRAAQENLQRIQGMQANLTFSLAGYSPLEVKQAIKQYKRIEAGLAPVPRGDQLSGALGAMILQGSPQKLQEFEKRYRNQQGIGEAIRLTGFSGAISDAQAAADKQQKELTEYITKQTEQLKTLQEQFTEFLANVIKAISKAKTLEAEDLATIIAQQIEAAINGQET